MTKKKCLQFLFCYIGINSEMSALWLHHFFFRKFFRLFLYILCYDCFRTLLIFWILSCFFYTQICILYTFFFYNSLRSVKISKVHLTYFFKVFHALLLLQWPQRYLLWSIFIVSWILFLFKSTLITCTSTISPTLTTSSGCLI